MHALAIGHIMRTPAPSVDQQTPLTEVVRLLRQYRLTGLPVTDADRRVVGFVSEHDCILSLLSCGYGATSATVSEVMSAAQCLSPADPLVEVALQMAKGGQPRVFPVVEQGVLVGLVTRGQVLELLAADCMNCELTRDAA